jgi:hypothetical protein
VNRVVPEPRRRKSSPEPVDAQGRPDPPRLNSTRPSGGHLRDRERPSLVDGFICPSVRGGIL